MTAYWDLKIEAGSVAQTRRRLRPFLSLTGLQTDRLKIARYWKMPEWYECQFATAGFSTDALTALAEVRAVCRLIGATWHETGVDLLDDGSLDFSTVFDARLGRGRVRYLRWAHCQLLPRQYDQPARR